MSEIFQISDCFIQMNISEVWKYLVKPVSDYTSGMNGLNDLPLDSFKDNLHARLGPSNQGEREHCGMRKKGLKETERPLDLS